MKGMRRLMLAAVMVLAVATVAGAITMPLSELLRPGVTLQQGDKIFGDFEYQGLVNPAVISIQGIGNGTALDLYGISIQGGLFAQDGGVLDIDLKYSVKVAEGYAFQISDIHQYVNIGISGEGKGSVLVHEDALDAPGGNVVAWSTVSEAFGVSDISDPPRELTDLLDINPPLKQIWIKKDILLVAGERSVISATIIEQRFSQTVPDGGSALMLLGGSFCLLGFVKRLIKKA